MIYLDIYPIIQKINSGDENVQLLFPFLGTLLDLVDSNLPSYDANKRNQFTHVNGDYFTYREANFFGDLTVKTYSTIIYPNMSSINARIDGTDRNFDSVIQIMPINIEGSTIKSDGGRIKGGYGFYSNIFMDSANVTLLGDPAVISLVFTDGSIETIQGKEILLNLMESDMFLRQPTISSNGKIKFVEFSGHGQIEKKVRMTGLCYTCENHDLQIDGYVTFSNKYPDVLTFANNALLEGKMKPSHPIYPYDEIRNLVDLSYSNFKYVLAIGISFVLINVLITYKIRK